MARPTPPDSPMNLTREEIAKLPESDHKKKTALVSLKGVAMKEDGSLTKSKYFSILDNTIDDYSDIVMTPDEAKRLQNVMMNLSHGSTAAMPVLCTGDLCPWRSRCVYYEMGKAPVGRQCHPAGEMILTSKHGYIPIEELNPKIHTLVSWERKKNIIRYGRNQHGSNFEIASRDFDEQIFTFVLDS